MSLPLSAEHPQPVVGTFVQRLNEYAQRGYRRLTLRFHPIASIRRLHLRLLGAKVGERTIIPKMQVTWPHQISIGKSCILQKDLFFNVDHYWVPGPSIVIGDRVFIGRGVEFNIRLHLVVGNDALIASGAKFIDHDHGTAPDQLIRHQEGKSAAITVGQGAWIGSNAVILKGAKIGDGAVIAAGAVVVSSVPPMEIWGGVPAKKIGERGQSRVEK